MMFVLVHCTANVNYEMWLLQMSSSSSSTSSTSTKPWVANKRQKANNGKRNKISKKICGAYNHRGCTVAECHFVHKYDLWAGVTYYLNIIPKAQELKGLIADSEYPEEFKDLRMRNRESMTKTELQELAKMPPLDSKVKPTTAKVADSSKKVGLKVSTHVKPEPAKPKLTREEREAIIRAERKIYVDEQMLKALHKASSDDGISLDAERKAINWEADIDMNIKFTALELEYQQYTEVGYMQQEKQEGKNGQDDRVYHHRFQLLTPGKLGVFNPGSPCNQSNVDDLALLLRNLNGFVVDEGDDSYVCRFCFRSLYPRKTRRERILCACLRCVSVLYCSPWCREEDAQGHRLSCFSHPAWECEEGTERRVKEMNATGLKAQQLVGQKVPTIEIVQDPKGNSRVKPDAAAHLIAELQTAQLAAAAQQEDAAQQQDVDDDDGAAPVGAVAQAAADDDAEQLDATKTVIDGNSVVDITEDDMLDAHMLRVQEAIRRSTPYLGN